MRNKTLFKRLLAATTVAALAGPASVALAATDGWAWEDGNWYYYSEGEPLTSSWLEDANYGNANFYLEEDGKMARGWRYIGNEWYLFGTSGRQKTGWIWSDEYAGWYYLNEVEGGTHPLGAMLRNTVAKDGSYVDVNGRWTMTPPAASSLTEEQQAFLDDLADDGYAEMGSYKVERMADGVYHMDEETEAVPGGATIPDYADRETGETVTGVMNNPSSIYFVVTDNEVVAIDGGDVLRSQEKYDSAKAILGAMTDGKPLTFIVTHGHSDHVRLFTTEGVLDDLNVKALYIGGDDFTDDGKVVGSTTATPLPVTVDLDKVHRVSDGDVVTVDGLDYEIISIAAHTPGSLAIVQRDKEVVFTGDSIGSGFVWAFWMYGTNPLGALQDGVLEIKDVISDMDNPQILAGHRWQQFASMFGDAAPKELTTKYLDDMDATIGGLVDGTTVQSAYTLRGNADDVELSVEGGVAKVDTQQAPIDAYLKHANAIELAGSYAINITGDDWGCGIDKAIVTLDAPLDAVSASDFVVTETKQAIDWTDPTFPTVVTSAKRTVTDAFFVDAAGKKSAKPTKTVEIDLAISPSEGSPFVWSPVTFYNTYSNPYQLSVAPSETAELTSGGKLVKGIKLQAEPAGTATNADDFALDEYETESGITYQYASWSPAKKSDTLVVWLHGMGEGQGADVEAGNTPLITLLGNKVTALAGDEFQKTVGGANILVPQAPTYWMDKDGTAANKLTRLDSDGTSYYTESLEELIDWYAAKVGAKKIVLTGASNGGYMVLNLAFSRPDAYAAVVPISETIQDKYITDEQIESIKDVPLYFVYCDADTTAVAANCSIPTIERLQEAGATNLKWSSTDQVYDLSGRFGTDDEYYTYSGHWAWVYFDNNECLDDTDLTTTAWDFIAEAVK